MRPIARNALRKSGKALYRITRGGAYPRVNATHGRMHHHCCRCRYRFSMNRFRSTKHEKMCLAKKDEIKKKNGDERT